MSTTSTKKSWGFVLVLLLLLASAFLSINTDLAQFSDRKDLQIPDFYFYIIFSIDLLIILSITLIYYYQKLGVFGLPISILMHFMASQFYLSTFRYTDVNLIFLFVVAGLFVVIPRWKEFK